MKEFVKMPTKIFIGNLPPTANNDIIRGIFENYGAVTECDVLGTFGFVHMMNEMEARVAIDALNGSDLHGSFMKVELSTMDTQGKKKRGRASTKIFVGNIKNGTTNDQLREIFEPYGEVTEADVIGGYGFVHMANEQQAKEALKDLDGFKLNGNALHVELSTTETKGAGRGKVRESVSHIVGERGRGGMMPWGPARGRGRGTMSSRFDPYSAPSGSSWLPRPDAFAANMHTAAEPAYPPQRGDDTSFARELLQLYSRDPAAFDAYARNPQVRRSLNLDPDNAGMRGAGGDSYMQQPTRDYMPESRLASARLMQPSLVMSSSSFGRQSLGQVPRLPMSGGAGLRPSHQQLYMSFE